MAQNLKQPTRLLQTDEASQEFDGPTASPQEMAAALEEAGAIIVHGLHEPTLHAQATAELEALLENAPILREGWMSCWYLLWPVVSLSADLWVWCVVWSSRLISSHY